MEKGERDSGKEREREQMDLVHNAAKLYTIYCEMEWDSIGDMWYVEASKLMNLL